MHIAANVDIPNHAPPPGDVRISEELVLTIDAAADELGMSRTHARNLVLTALGRRRAQGALDSTKVLDAGDILDAANAMAQTLVLPGEGRRLNRAERRALKRSKQIEARKARGARR